MKNSIRLQIAIRATMTAAVFSLATTDSLLATTNLMTNLKAETRNLNGWTVAEGSNPSVEDDIVDLNGWA